MLSSISWQQYLAAIVLISVSYYLYVILRYYQSEISSLFKPGKNSNPFPGIAASNIQVMGAAKLENGVSISDTQELQFDEPTPDEIDSHNEDVSIVDIHNPSLELVAEAGNLIEAFKDIDNKVEFLSLLQILISSYKRFKNDIDLPGTLKRVIELSSNKLLFPVTIADLQSNWE